MNRTGIDYLDYSWNPLAMRCTPVSPACDHCWHLRMAKRKAGNPKLSDLERQASAGLIPPVIIPSRIDEPLRMKKPQRIGVQFMGDLFHEDVDVLDIYRIFDIMARCQNQTFVCLTKRPERMLDFCRRLRLISPAELAHLTAPGVAYDPTGPQKDPRPLPNVWLGVTVENQEQADQRLPILLQIPAAIRFVSYEPALGPVIFEDYHPILGAPYIGRDYLRIIHNPVTGKDERGRIDWIVAGGETGPHARPSHPNWFRSARDQAVAAGVPFFFKSWGEWAEGSDSRVKNLCVYNDGRAVDFTREAILAEEKRTGLLHNDFNPVLMSRVGKRAAGRALDEGEWDELPEVVG